MNTLRNFSLDLCMAGAISAGAYYTAGIIDYLVQGLDRWDKARQANVPRILTHRVVIDRMIGASAGGMTVAISLDALFDRLNPVYEPYRCYEHFTDLPGLGTINGCLYTTKAA